MRTHSFNRKPAYILSLVIAASIAQAQAQDENVEEVVVTGYRASLENALANKRTAVNFTDSVTAEDVGKLPDNNLAEALQRVPGVQISRTNGEGQQISLRGLGPSFARVLLDGMPVSAASEGSVDEQARNRQFDFDILPSEIFSNLSVSKTPRASLVEGGLSGTVDMRAPRPFDYQGFTASYQLQGGYSTNSEELDPKASFLISNTWNDSFGALLSLTTSERSFRTDGWSSQGWMPGIVAGNPPAPGYGTASNFVWNLPSVAADPANTAPGFINESGLTNAQLANVMVPRLPRPEMQIGTRDRIGGTLALQWIPSEALSVNFDVIYGKLEADFDRYTNNLLVRGNTGSNNTTGFGWPMPSEFEVDSNNTLTHGVLSNTKFWSENRVMQQESDFLHTGIGAKWELTDNLSLEGKWGRQESDFRWRMTTYLLLSAPGTVTLDLNDRLPEITPGYDIADISNWDLNTVRVQPRLREETNDNLSFEFTWGDENNNLKLGTLLNEFYRERLPYNTSVGATAAQWLEPFGYPTGFTNMSTFDITNYAQVVPVTYGKNMDNIGYKKWAVADLDAFGDLISYNQLDDAANLDYQQAGSFEEENLSLYLEGNMALDIASRELRINAGLRYVETDMSMTGILRSAAITDLFNVRPDVHPEWFTTQTTKGDYSELLPSLNLSYELTDDVMGRFSISRAISRPNPADIQPFKTFNTNGSVVLGNPNLDPYLADQVDLGVEWYFDEGSVLGGNIFYKDITGFITRTNTQRPFSESGIPITGITDATLLSYLRTTDTNGDTVIDSNDAPNPNTLVNFNEPINVDSATYLRGMELLYQQRLDMILEGMGISLNYTHLDSGDAVIEGLAENNYNATLYYEADRYSLRMSYTARGKYVECPVNCFGTTSPQTQYRAKTGYLDFSSSLNFNLGSQELTASFEILNALDEEEYSYFSYDNRASVLNRPGRQFVLGIRGQF